MAVENNGFMGFLYSYLEGTPTLRVVGHTLIVVTWGLISLFLYEGYTRVRDGERLVESVIADFNTLNSRHLEAYTETQDVIEDLLGELVRQTEADRAMLVLLHNGKNSVGGVPFLSVSGYAEAYRKGLSAAVFRLDGVPLTVVSNLDETLAGHIAEYRPNETREGDAVESIGVDRVMRGPVIRSFDGAPHGWIFLGYTEAGWARAEPVRAVERRLVERYTDVLTGVLNSVDLKKILREMGSPEEDVSNEEPSGLRIRG